MCTGYGYCCCGGLMNLVKYNAATGIIKWQRNIKYELAKVVMGVVYNPGDECMYATLAQQPTGIYESETDNGETYLAQVNPNSGALVKIIDGVYPTNSRWGVNMFSYWVPFVAWYYEMAAKSINVDGDGNILVVGGKVPLDSDHDQNIFIFWIHDGEVIDEFDTGLKHVARATPWSVCGVHGSDDAIFFRSGYAEAAVDGGSTVELSVTKRVTRAGAVVWSKNAAVEIPCNFAPDGTIGCANGSAFGSNGNKFDAATGVSSAAPTIGGQCETPVWLNGAWSSATKAGGGFGTRSMHSAVNPSGDRIATVEDVSPEWALTEPLPPPDEGPPNNNSSRGLFHVCDVRTGKSVSTMVWRERGPNGAFARGYGDTSNDDVAPLGVTWPSDDYVIAGGYPRDKFTNEQRYQRT